MMIAMTTMVRKTMLMTAGGNDDLDVETHDVEDVDHDDDKGEDDNDYDISK